MLSVFCAVKRSDFSLKWSKKIYPWQGKRSLKRSDFSLKWSNLPLARQNIPDKAKDSWKSSDISVCVPETYRLIPRKAIFIPEKVRYDPLKAIFIPDKVINLAEKVKIEYIFEKVKYPWKIQINPFSPPLSWKGWLFFPTFSGLYIVPR